MRKYLKKLTYLDYFDFALPLVFIMTLPMCYLGMWSIWTILKFYVLSFSIYVWYKIPKSPQSKFKSLFNAFMLINTLSGIAYIYNGRPFSLFIGDYFNYVAPMIFTYIAMADRRANRFFYDRLLVVGTVIIGLGILCYLTLPSWYLSRMVEVKNSAWYEGTEYDENSILGAMRFSAFFQDSYPISHYSVFLLSIAWFNYYRKDIKKKYTIVCVVISLVAAFLSMHRSAIACAVLISVGIFFYEFARNKSKNTKIIVFVLLLIVGTAMLSPDLLDRGLSVVDMISDRVDGNMSFSKALAERKMTDQLLDTMQFYAFGHGIGSAGAGARQLGLISVTDMHYVKLFYESGLVGTLLFASLMIMTLIRCIRYKSYFACEFCIISFILVAMTGSNSLSLYYLFIPPFWYAVGRVWNRKYLKQAKINKIKI